jgi:hypothetical protein
MIASGNLASLSLCALLPAMGQCCVQCHLYVLGSEPRARAEEHEPGSQVLKLANIPRPRILLKHLQCRLCHTRYRSSVLGAIVFKKVLDEQGNILAPSAQRGHLYRENMKAIE